MKKVYITRSILPDGISKLQQNGFTVEVWDQASPVPPEILHSKAQTCQALITMLSDKIDEHFLKKNSHLKIITNYAVGTNNIDKVTANKIGIVIGNTPDVLTEATAEVAFGLMIACARQFKAASKNAQSGQWKTWEPMGFLGVSLKNKTLGILGNGRIGKEMAQLSKGAFNMNIKIYNRGDDLLLFLKDLDVLSLHIPLNAETEKIIGARELASMKPEAIIINTARGEVIDQDELYKAIKENRLFGAGLDVTYPEPLPDTHPLYSLDQVLILPHIGSATFEARKKMSLKCADNIINAFKSS